MKIIPLEQVKQVSGGKCQEYYEAQVPLNFLPIVAEHLKKLNQRQFDSNALLDALTNAGLDPNQVALKVSVLC